MHTEAVNKDVDKTIQEERSRVRWEVSLGQSMGGFKMVNQLGSVRVNPELANHGRTRHRCRVRLFTSCLVKSV